MVFVTGGAQNPSRACAGAREPAPSAVMTVAEPSERLPAAGAREQIAALLAVSRAVARGGELGELLDVIAREAARVVGARSASILLLREKGMFRLGGSFNLSARYCAYLEGPLVARGDGPSGLVLQRGDPVLIEDADDSSALGPRGIAQIEARQEGCRAMASVPLRSGEGLLGVLHVYRATKGPWPDEDVELLSYFAEHAAHAFATARLLDHSERQVSALSQLVRGLRYQTHEYANRIHAISGLLALGEHRELAALVADLQLRHHRSYEAVVSRIGNSAVAGLILAEMAMAQQRGIELTLDARSHLDALPPRLEEAGAITILGNLLENAFDAVSAMPRARRRVSVYVRASRTQTTLRVRDWGPGIAPSVREQMFEPGATTKADHAGIGLRLVAGAASAAHGQIDVESNGSGTTVRVTVPHG